MLFSIVLYRVIDANCFTVMSGRFLCSNKFAFWRHRREQINSHFSNRYYWRWNEKSNNHWSAWLPHFCSPHLWMLLPHSRYRYCTEIPNYHPLSYYFKLRQSNRLLRVSVLHIRGRCRAPPFFRPGHCFPQKYGALFSSLSRKGGFSKHDYRWTNYSENFLRLGAVNRTLLWGVKTFCKLSFTGESTNRPTP